MKLIVGLGNPGSEYERTRHNAGFLVIDRLVKKHGGGAIPRARFSSVCVEATIGPEKCLLLKPTTFMNASGRAVAEPVNFFKLDLERDVLVLVDDVYLPCGTIRIRGAGSAGGHNGLIDIERALGTDRYPRLRIGVDPKPAVMALHDYVLGRFTPEQQAALEPALERSAEACAVFASQGLTKAMNIYNAGEKPAGAPKAKAPPERSGPTPASEPDA
jgi:peptidyl-tRNA hydrolase, PTH1 family